jgi:hypothetical protein
MTIERHRRDPFESVPPTITPLHRIAIPRNLLADILRLIAELRPPVALAAEGVERRAFAQTARRSLMTENTALFDAGRGADPFGGH